MLGLCAMRMQWTLQHGMGMRDNAAEAQVMYHQFRGKRPREITRKGAVYRRCSSCPASRRPTGHLMVVHGIHQSYRYFDSVLLLCGGHALPLPCSDLGMATIKPLWDKASAFTMQRAGAHAGRLSFVSNFDCGAQDEVGDPAHTCPLTNRRVCLSQLQKFHHRAGTANSCCCCCCCCNRSRAVFCPCAAN